MQITQSTLKIIFKNCDGNIANDMRICNGLTNITRRWSQLLITLETLTRTSPTVQLLTITASLWQPQQSVKFYRPIRLILGLYNLQHGHNCHEIMWYFEAIGQEFMQPWEVRIPFPPPKRPTAHTTARCYCSRHGNELNIHRESAY